jgi:hypothetical protein
MKRQHYIALGVAIFTLALILIATVFRSGTSW